DERAPGHDADQPLRRVFGEGPNEQEDLRALSAAAQEPDVPRRFERLKQTLDLERFISFMAMEVISGHRDGYCLSRNNFRIYCDSNAGKIVFLPQGDRKSVV